MTTPPTGTGKGERGSAKLEALDDTTRILFLTKDLVAIYHTNQRGRNWRTATRQLEAFFISAKDGSLLRTKSWPTALCRSEDELWASEARLIRCKVDVSWG